MVTENKTFKLMIAIGFALGANSLMAGEASAQKVLQGNISKVDTITRLERPGNSTRVSNSSMPPLAPPVRLNRASQGNLVASNGQFDVSTFKNDFKLNASQGRLGIAKPDDFFAKNKFDLGADSNSRELRVAWERWHQQFSKAIYDTWSAVADEPGRTTLRVTVRRDRSIQIQLVNSDASGRFNRQLQDSIQSLSGNPGLTFPGKSQRQFVSFEADYIAARNVKPGYSWVKDDFETVRENF